MIRRYAQSPAVISGYDLDDVFSIVVPVARTNEVTNPSVETNTTGYSALFGAIARVSTQQYHGAYSLQCTPSVALTDGCFFNGITTTLATRAISCKFLGPAGLSYTFAVTNAAATSLAEIAFTATGRWQWLYLYFTDTSVAARRIYWRKDNHASVAPFYIDGVQSEVLGSLSETVSTYLDGDQLGLVPNQNPAAYIWTGTPHASSSTRSGLTRAGGMVVKFKDYSFLLTAIVGLGLALPQNVKTEYARLDGAYDDYTRKPTRMFALAGTFQGRSYQELRDNRSQVARLLDRDLLGLDQRMTLLHHVEGPCGEVMTNTSRVLCKYAGGLGGNTTNHAAEDAAIQFEQYLPFVVSDAEAGSALSVQQTVTNMNLISQRTPAGQWQALSTGMSGGTPLLALARGNDGTIYAGGSFTDAGGSGADYVASWNGTAWSVLVSATSINAAVRSLAVSPDGRVFVGGSFTNADGIANGDGIAVFNPVANSWAALGTGVAAGGSVRALAFDASGNLYAGGDFTQMGGVANTARIAKWDGTVWTALGTGSASGTVQALAVDARGNVYAGGSFANMGGVAAADGIAYWNATTSAWSALSTGTANTVYALTIGPNGVLYVGGDFATIGALTTNFLATWNGVTFSALGTFAGTSVYSLAFDRSGTLHVGGFWTTLNGVTFPDSFARLISNTFIPEDIDLTGSASVFAILPGNDGSLTIGHGNGTSAVAAGITTVTNTGTAKAYPTLKITGPTTGTSRIYQLVNYTNQRSLYFNLTISAGETITMTFQPDNLSFQSTFAGSVASNILTGSNESDWFLQPGANIISFYAADSTTTAVLTWRPQFASLDDVR